MTSRTIQDTVRALPRLNMPRLPAPPYAGPREDGRARVGLAVESMKHHMTDEGWQIFAGLGRADYLLCGHNLFTPLNLPQPGDYWGHGGSDILQILECATDVKKILGKVNPGTVLVQDKREWDLAGPRDFRDPAARFTNVEALRDRPDVFKLTILKDAQQRAEYHRQSADEMGVHAWVIYYHPRIVEHLAPYVRPEHLVRTYHTVDADLVPPYAAAGRHGCILSGAVSNAYPLRQDLLRSLHTLPQTTYLHHPGYHRDGCATPAFLQTLSRYKVAICTASVYGYALRKIIEATACGCRVITDLPEDEVLPHIDGNLTRVHPCVSPFQMSGLINQLLREYDPAAQLAHAVTARARYDYRAVTAQLAEDIETLRLNYNGGP